MDRFHFFLPVFSLPFLCLPFSLCVSGWVRCARVYYSSNSQTMNVHKISTGLLLAHMHTYTPTLDEHTFESHSQAFSSAFLFASLPRPLRFALSICSRLVRFEPIWAGLFVQYRRTLSNGREKITLYKLAVNALNSLEFRNCFPEFTSRVTATGRVVRKLWIYIQRTSHYLTPSLQIRVEKNFRGPKLTRKIKLYASFSGFRHFPIDSKWTTPMCRDDVRAT